MAISYRDAGVDVSAGDALVERIKPLARRTLGPEVLGGIGGFASLFRMPEGVEDPLLVSGTDGVGTKLKVAFATGNHGTVGQDLVAMCVNDVVTTGARPLFFLDYFGCGELDVNVAESVIAGIAKGCELAGCALIGGETAELPGMYAKGEYDLAGFAVGVVGRAALLGGHRVRDGDRLVAVRSSGLHSNGFSLARRVLEDVMGLDFTSTVDGLGSSLGDVLLTPTRIYAKAVASLTRVLGADLRALCHVTGGGIVGNLPRVLPDSAVAEVSLNHTQHPIFDVIAGGGPVEPDEMQRTFNLGIGLIAVVNADASGRAIDTLEASGETAWDCGMVRVAEGHGPATVRIDG
jgi:phosphoribosylformylglycinamidine cyclo-ligase